MYLNNSVYGAENNDSNWRITLDVFKLNMANQLQLATGGIEE